MSYNSSLPADTTAPEEIRENFRALKEDKIVAANTAATLETARTINGVSFDGSADITITQVDGVDIATVDDVSATYDADHSLETDGYQKLSNGLILQWGYVSGSISTNGSVDVTFPIAFPTQVLNISNQYIASGVHSSSVANCLLKNTYTLTGCTFMQDTGAGNGTGLFWSAIGY